MEASISLDKLLQFSFNANDKCWLGERSIEETEKETEAKIVSLPVRRRFCQELMQGCSRY